MRLFANPALPLNGYPYCGVDRLKGNVHVHPFVHSQRHSGGTTTPHPSNNFDCSEHAHQSRATTTTQAGGNRDPEFKWVGIPIGVFFAGLCMGGVLPEFVANLTPWALVSPLAMELADSTRSVSSIVPVIATIAWIIALTAGAIWRFKKEEF